MPAHVDASEHFRMFATTRTDDLDGSSGQGPNPSINNRTAKDGKNTKKHEYEHNNLIFPEENPDIHNDNSNEY